VAENSSHLINSRYIPYIPLFATNATKKKKQRKSRKWEKEKHICTVTKLNNIVSETTIIGITINVCKLLQL